MKGAGMAMIEPASRSDQSIRLRDGRTLGYAEYGVPDGNALLYFHGYPGARLEGQFLAEQAVKAGVRLIAVDRPGMGLSSYQAHRHILDWPDDIAEFADYLGLEHFAVVGFSGGGPFATACAYRLPDRVVACGIVAGAGLTGFHHYILSRVLPWLMTPAMRRLFQDEIRSRQTLQRMAGNWVEPDKRALTVPGVADILTASLTEAFRQGARGAAQEGTLLGAPWGFKLEDMTLSSVYLWHGELDREVLIAMGRGVAARLAHCTATYYPDDGHISLIVNHAEEIVARLSS